MADFIPQPGSQLPGVPTDQVSSGASAPAQVAAQPYGTPHSGDVVAQAQALLQNVSNTPHDTAEQFWRLKQQVLREVYQLDID